MAYFPLTKSVGSLPDVGDPVKDYDLTVDGGIPPKAKEVFIYTFVTTTGEGEEFQRGYYTMFTKEGETKYAQYLNVATGQGVTAVNSENMWFPVGDGKLTVKLTHPSKKSIAAKLSKGKHSNLAEATEEWSEVFIIGYRL